MKGGRKKGRPRTFRQVPDCPWLDVEVQPISSRGEGDGKIEEERGGSGGVHEREGEEGMQKRREVSKVEGENERKEEKVVRRRMKERKDGKRQRDREEDIRGQVRLSEEDKSREGNENRSIYRKTQLGAIMVKLVFGRCSQDRQASWRSFTRSLIHVFSLRARLF